MSKFGLSETDIKILLETLQKYHGVEEVIIYGSRAKGNYKNGSDVDIALKGNVTHETINSISYILNEETIMPYRFDIQNYHTISNQDLIEHIDRVGIVFYKREIHV